MTESEARKHLVRLWKKWGTSREPPDADRLAEFIHREYRAARDGKIIVSNGLMSEMRYELSLCGKIRHALSKEV